MRRLSQYQITMLFFIILTVSLLFVKLMNLFVNQPYYEGIIILIIVLTYFLLSKKNNIINPLMLFTVAWFGGMGISRLQLSYWQMNWSFVVYFIFFISATSFYFGYFIIEKLFKKKSINYNEKKKNYDIDNYINIIFVLGLIVFIVKIIRLGNVPMFMLDVASARKAFVLPKFEVFINFLMILPSLCFLNLKVNKKYIKKYIFYILLVLFFLALTLNRFYLIQSICISSITYLSYNYKNLIKLGKKFKVFIVILAPSIVLFMNYSSKIRFIKYGENYITTTANLKYDLLEKYSFFTQAYMYIGMCYDNIAYLIMNNYTSAGKWLGLRSIPIISNSVLTDYAEKNNIIENFYPLVIDSYNVFTYLHPYYVDFGMIGCIIGPFILGIVVSLIYNKFLIENSYKWILLYSIFAFGITFIFFTNWFSYKQGTGTILLVILVFIIYRRNMK